MTSRTEATQRWRDKYLPVAHSLAATVAVIQFTLEAGNDRDIGRALDAAAEKLARLSYAQHGPELCDQEGAA